MGIMPGPPHAGDVVLVTQSHVHHLQREKEEKRFGAYG